MNTRTLLALSTLLVLSLSGCGQKDAAAPAAAAPAASAGPRVIEITAGDTMKYSLAAIEAKPGEDLKIVLTNNGSLPKEAMGHNWVLLKKDSDGAAFASAAVAAKATDYIPANLADQVIAHIETLGPRKSGEVAFKAPTEPGDYPFLCSFPGHYALMKGVLTVK